MNPFQPVKALFEAQRGKEGIELDVLCPGTVSLDRRGEVVFERPVPLTSTAITDYWREQKDFQLRDVRANVVLETVKSAGLSRTVEICGRKEKVRTYVEWLQRVDALDVAEVVKSAVIPIHFSRQGSMKAKNSSL